MKRFLLLVIFLLCLDHYLRAPKRVEPAPAAVQATPAPQFRRYFHSSLDAPAMSVGSSTGTGYYSTDPASSFGRGAVLGEGNATGAIR